MKKTISLMISFFLIISFFGISGTNASGETTNVKASVLDWSIFSKSNALNPENGAGKRMNCELEKTQKLIRLNATSTTSDAYETEMEALGKVDPGYVQDVKGCIMEQKINKIISWFVYLTISGLVLVVLYTLLMSAMSGSSSGGGDPYGDPGGSSGGGDVMGEIKKPLQIAAILFLLVLGILNPLLRALAWAKDAILG